MFISHKCEVHTHDPNEKVLTDVDAWLTGDVGVCQAPISGQIYMRKIPRVTSTACAGSSGTVVAPGYHLLNMVQVVAPRSNHRSAGKQRPGTIAPFNVFAIRHPVVAGQVLYYPVSKSCVSDSI